jgi:Tol biopolymer transport system component
MRRGFSKIAASALLLVVCFGSSTMASPTHRILFVAGTDNDYAIYSVVPGEDPVRVSAGDQPLWSPDGSQFAFINDGRIFVASATGEDLRAITPKRMYVFNPGWSPDGAWLTFQNFQNQIGVVRVGGGNLHIVARGGVASPDWSPDGDWIAFSRCGNASCHIAKVNAASKRVVDLTRKGARPLWSPDGRVILFQYLVRGSNVDLFSVRANGTNVRNLTRTRVREGDPRWSPGGSRIAYRGYSNVKVMRRDGSHQKSVARGFSPDWSPNGTHLAFARDVGDGSQIFTVDISKGATNRLTDTQGFASSPQWQP